LLGKSLYNFNQAQKEVTKTMILKALKKDKINHHDVFKLVLPTDGGYSVKEIDDKLLADSLSDYLRLRFDKNRNRFSL